MASRERAVSFKIKASDEYSAQLKAARDALTKLKDAQEATARQRIATDQTQALRKQIDQVAAAYKRAQAEAKQLGAAANINLDSSAPTEAASGFAAFDKARTRALELKNELERLNAQLNTLRGVGGGAFVAFSAGADVMQRQATAARAAAAALREQQEAQRQAAAAARQALGGRTNAALGTASRFGPQQAADTGPENRLQAQAAKMREASQQAARLQADYSVLRAETARLGKALSLAEEPTERLVTDFEQSKAKLAALRAEMARVQAQTTKMAGGFARFARSEAFMVAKSGPSAAPGKAQGWWARNVDAFVGASSTAHGRGPLGLRPYELQNLSYQINDLVTQVASGTPVMQAFAQQGGQIAQIFPKATAAILRMAPTIAAAVAAVVPFIAAFSRLRETSDILQDFQVHLAATVDPTQYDPSKMTALVRSLQDIGVAADVSRKAIGSMMQEGMAPDRIQAVITAARDFSTVWGKELPDAIETVRGAFDGTYDSLKELDDQYNFLTAAQRTQIRTLYEQGHEVEATRRALEIFTERQNEAADLAEGEWSTAINNLTTAWRNLLDWLGTTAPVQGAIAVVNGLASVVNSLTGALTAMDAQADSTLAKIAKISLNGIVNPGAVPGMIAGWVNGPATGYTGPKSGGRSPDDRESEQDIKRTEDTEIERRKALLKAMAETGALVEKAEAERQEKLAAAAKQAAEDKAKALGAIDEQIADTLFQDTITGLPGREAAVLKALRQAEETAAKGGIALDEERRQQIIATTGALWDQEEAVRAAAKAEKDRNKKGPKGKSDETLEREKQRDLEKELNSLLERRELLLNQLDLAEQLGDHTKVQGLKDSVANVNGEITTAIANLRAFWAGASNQTEAQTAMLKLEALEVQLAQTGERGRLTGEELAQMTADMGSGAVDDFISGMEQGEDAIESFFNAFRKGAAEFLQQIAQMILQQMILNALGGGKAGTATASIASAITGAVLHQGGIVGAGGPRRSVPAALFAGAPRYHTGGVIGLKPNEVPVIAKRGEEMLTEGDPRHSRNGGGATLNAKIVNVLDPTEVLEAALSSSAGEKIILNWMSRNRRKIDATVG